MTIQLTCRCGKSFFAEQQWAGQPAICPYCRARLEIPVEAPASAVGQPYVQAPQPKSSSFNPLLLLCAAGGAVLLLVVAMVVVMMLGDEEPPVAGGPPVAPAAAGDATGAAPSQPAANPPPSSSVRGANSDNQAKADNFPFDQPPSNPSIRVVEEPWVPNPALVVRLAEPLQLGALSIRLPKGFFRTDSVGGAFTWKRPSLVAATQNDTILIQAGSWDREPQELARFESQHLQQIKREADPGSGGRLQRGRLGRIFCLRRTYKSASNPPLYDCAYQLLDGDTSIVVELLTYSRPDTPDYKILETALRTISRRSR